MYKKLSEIQNTTWYKIIKIIYILLFLLLALAIFKIGVIVATFQKVDAKNSFLTCGAGLPPQNLQHVINGGAVGLFSPHYFPDNQDHEDLKTFCNNANYKLDLAKKNSMTWPMFGLTMSKYLIGLMLIFEVIKRIFYFLIFKTIRPKK